MGPRCAQHTPHGPHLGPRCAPDSLTLLNTGPTTANIGPPHTPKWAGARLLGVSLEIYIYILYELQAQQLLGEELAQFCCLAGSSDRHTCSWKLKTKTTALYPTARPLGQGAASFSEATLLRQLWASHFLH